MNVTSEAIPAVDARGKYAPELVAIRGRKISGVYIIMDAQMRTVHYVGESHTGNLYDTITRHFRKWKIDPSSDRQHRRRGGTTYDRRRCTLIVHVCPAEEAADRQYKLIQQLKPQDNSIDCHTCGTDAAPF